LLLSAAEAAYFVDGLMIWEVLSPVLSNRHKIFSDSLQRADFSAFFEVGSNPHGSYAFWELNGFLT
jgi:hypothetical protein